MKYELIMMIHYNETLQYRHYYSYIKIDNNWYEFNDFLVKKFQIQIKEGLMLAYYFTKH